MYKLIKQNPGERPEILATFKDKDEARSFIDFLEPGTKRMLFIEGSVYTSGTLYALVAVPTHAIIRTGMEGAWVVEYTTFKNLPSAFARALYGMDGLTPDQEELDIFRNHGSFNCVQSGDDLLLVELD